MSSGSGRAVALLAHLCSSCSSRAVSDADVPCGAGSEGRVCSSASGRTKVGFSRRHAPSSAACRRREAEVGRPRPRE
eukprot:6637858-Prymnesium_polylepis.1